MDRTSPFSASEIQPDATSSQQPQQQQQQQRQQQTPQLQDQRALGSPRARRPSIQQRFSYGFGHRNDNDIGNGNGNTSRSREASPSVPSRRASIRILHDSSSFLSPQQQLQSPVSPSNSLNRRPSTSFFGGRRRNISLSTRVPPKTTTPALEQEAVPSRPRRSLSEPHAPPPSEISRAWYRQGLSDNNSNSRRSGYSSIPSVPAIAVTPDQTAASAVITPAPDVNGNENVHLSELPTVSEHDSQQSGTAQGQGQNHLDPNAMPQSPPPTRARGLSANAMSSLTSPSIQRRGRASTITNPPLSASSWWESHKPSSRSRSRRGSKSSRVDENGQEWSQPNREYGNSVVNLLDAVDPEVSTLTTLTNVQNSLFVPNLGSFINRRPAYVLSGSWADGERPPSRRASRIDGQPPEQQPPPSVAPVSRYNTLEEDTEMEHVSSTHTEDSLVEEHSFDEERNKVEYMILPDGVDVDGWTDAEIAQLNDHVRHMLHSRRSKFKRGFRGFLQYVSKPLGFLVTLYAVLITLFGLAWVLFLIGWIYVGNRQSYIINVIDNVLVALFAVMGDGLAPFRAVDTYHMAFIAHYGRLTWKLRKERNLKALKNKNDLPMKHSPGQQLEDDRDVDPDLEQGTFKEDGDEELSVLTLKQQQRLAHHQAKFAKSHTFYKPHETMTHYAFSLNLLIVIVVLLDLHSCFQIALGTCTWSISYHHRPFALTTVILCCSITCNIVAGLIIWIGDRRTRKVEVIKRMFRQELTGEAIKKMQKKRRRHEKKALKEEHKGQRKSLTLSRKSRKSTDGEMSPDSPTESSTLSVGESSVKTGGRVRRSSDGALGRDRRTKLDQVIESKSLEEMNRSRDADAEDTKGKEAEAISEERC